MTRVVIDGLTKRYVGRPPVTALAAATLEVPDRSLVAVLGPSGCGKSTLLRCIAGFERPDSGTITIGDRSVVDDDHEVGPDQRDVGVVPQDGALFPHLDVHANIAFGLRRLDRPARARRVGELLELTGLTGLSDRRPDELSGGQRQRVALARALAPEPSVVLLDEPFSALDADLRATVRTEVVALLARTGTTAIFVTHDQAEALAVADLVAVMRDGRILQTATPRDLYAHPVDLHVARSVGAGTTLAGHGQGTTATCIAGTVPTDRSIIGPLQLFVRPEQVVPDPDGQAATVVTVQFSGHDQLLALDVAGAPLTARWPVTSPVAVGDVLAIRIVGPVAAFPERP